MVSELRELFDERLFEGQRRLVGLLRRGRAVAHPRGLERLVDRPAAPSGGGGRDAHCVRSWLAIDIIWLSVWIAVLVSW